MTQDEATPEAPAPAPVPGPSPESIEELQEQAVRAQALEARVEELEDRIKRMQADFVNETRRISRQAEADRAFSIQRVVVDLLPLVDAIHQAEEALGETEEARRLRQGLELVARQLEDVLKRHGVERIEALGQPFDPTRHEAFMMVEQAELPPGTVAQVVRPGFTLQGRVVRPAHVTVTRAPDPPKSDGPAKPDGAESA